METQFITAEEVKRVLDVSHGRSYQIVRDLSKELKSMGYRVTTGKRPIQFFKQKFYGLETGGDNAWCRKMKKQPFRLHLLAQVGSSRSPM